MDRRKTLAGLSPAQLNSRASLAPGRGGKAGGPAAKLPLDKALSRMSLAGPVATRRSSAYTTKASGLKSDPRPVSDKGFQAACVRTVIAYLAAHGFEYAITPKVLFAGAGCCPAVYMCCLLCTTGLLVVSTQEPVRSAGQPPTAAAAQSPRSQHTQPPPSVPL